MFRGMILVSAFLIGGMILLHTVLSNGAALRYLDAHPDARWVPVTEYSLGEVYYFFQDVPTAAVYFSRVSQRYPISPQAEACYFEYLQCEDDTLGISRDILIAEDQKYLERYPNGLHATIIRNRIDALRSGPH